MSAPHYPEAAPASLVLGWSPVPLEAGTKDPPPDGFTGKDGAFVTADDVARWRRNRKYRRGNLRVRLPRGVIGVDVDQYGEKHGADEMAKLEKELWELPPTYPNLRVPGQPSRIKRYRVPAGVTLPGKPCAGLEFVQCHHRYMASGATVCSFATYHWYQRKLSTSRTDVHPASPERFTAVTGV